MKRSPAEYRKAIVTAAGALLLVAAQLQPLLHGTALRWVSLAVAVATVITTYRAPNALTLEARRALERYQARKAAGLPVD